MLRITFREVLVESGGGGGGESGIDPERQMISRLGAPTAERGGPNPHHDWPADNFSHICLAHVTSGRSTPAARRLGVGSRGCSLGPQS
jgi:hypothetical protein